MRPLLIVFLAGALTACAKNATVHDNAPRDTAADERYHIKYGRYPPAVEDAHRAQADHGQSNK